MTAPGWLVLLVVALVCLEAGRLIRRLCRNLPTSADSTRPMPPSPADWGLRPPHWPPMPDPWPPPPVAPCYWDAPEPWTRARSPKTACASHGGSPWDCPLPLEVVTLMCRHCGQRHATAEHPTVLVDDIREQILGDWSPDLRAKLKRHIDTIEDDSREFGRLMTTTNPGKETPACDSAGLPSSS